jgi:CDP-4-dehydro-6-deoxyglucose reductase, E1
VTPRGKILRDQIAQLVGEYHAEEFGPSDFVAGQSSVPVSGKVLDAEDMQTLVESALDFWLTTGRFAAQFEKEFAKVMGVKHAVLVNSGSSANLLALSALTSAKLEDRRLVAGDEVITVAAGFPTTVNPILQNGLVPVFVDIHVPTYDIDVTQLEPALSDRTRAIMLAHTLGNPFDLEAVSAFAKKHDLWLIEDCCDAIGTTYRGRGVGTFGDLATTSFYPAHHITMGEGGSVLTGSSLLRTLVESFRDWGRDCWCEPGKDNTCGKRFDWQLGTLPCGFDHKYTYSHVGYNLKATDMQAAIGVSQLKKLPAFVEARRRNFRVLHQALSDLQDVYLLPQATAGSDPSWFGFPLAIRPDAPFDRRALTERLGAAKIASRPLFAGNLVRQPAYQGRAFRVVGDLKSSDFAMDHVLWLGVFPGITNGMLDHMVSILREMAGKHP